MGERSRHKAASQLRKREEKMEISGILSGASYLFPNIEKENGGVTRQSGDIVDIRQPEILSDEEAENVYNDTIAMIGQDGAAALSVHSGLSENRVFALLGL